MQLPATNPLDALSALRTQFEILENDSAYVDFSGFRNQHIGGNLRTELNIMHDEHFVRNEYSKILFTGHTGSGKTTELKRLNKYFNHPNRFFSIYVQIQEEFDISTFEQEDLFYCLISSLLNELNNNNISFNANKLERLGEDLLKSDKEKTETYKKEIAGQLGVEANIESNIGVLFYKLLSLKGGVKSMISGSSATTEQLKIKIRNEKNKYIERFNEILIDIRESINKANKGREILYIIDGLERLRFDKYDEFLQTFFRDVYLIQNLNANLICCVPIDSRYDVHNIEFIRAYYQPYELPLIDLHEESIPLFKQLISKRIDVKLFLEDDAFEYLIKMSGGHPRQLINLVSASIQNSSNQDFKADLTIAKEICNKQGLQLRRTLTSAQFDILKNGNLEGANDEILILLYSSCIFEYNGNTNQRKVNPLLLPFLK